MLRPPRVPVGRASVPLVKQCALILMESNPIPDGNTAVETKLKKIPGVLAVENVWIWQQDSPSSLIAMVHLKCNGSSIEILRLAKRSLAAEGIHISTVEINNTVEIEPQDLEAADDAISSILG